MKRITEDMIKAWIGSDNMSVDAFVGLLTEFINDEYTLDDFKNDVLTYDRNEESEQ
jgi:hypothetical protein